MSTTSPQAAGANPQAGSRAAHRRPWQTLSNWFSVLLFTALFVVFIVQITARFAFDRPLAWTDELAVVLYIWVVLSGAVMCCKQAEHIAFDLLYGLVPKPVQRVMRIASSLLVGGLFAWAIPETWSYIDFMQRDNTPVLQFSFRIVFLPFLVFMMFVVSRQLLALWRLLSTRWETEL